MEPGHLHLGTTEEGETISIPAQVLKRHVALLGASGSGKTVFGKVLIEEAALNGIPSIIIDPQGDLASLAINATLDELKGHKFDKGFRDSFKEMAEVRVFTPASKKGIPISVNPLRFPEKEVSREEMVRTIDLTATGITQLIGYGKGSDSGRSCQKYLYSLLYHCWDCKVKVEDLEQFSLLAMEPDQVGFEEPEKIITPSLRAKVSTKLKYLSMGVEGLLFNLGTKVDIDTLMTPVQPGKIPVNIIYLNTLTSAEHKQFFVAMLAKELYTWMLQNPSDNVQLAFYIDEVGPYLPPHPYNPPSKEMISLLFKQGRKYGVSCFMCTQNPADVDYKAMSQANTLGFGRMITKQDRDKVKHILKSASPNDAQSIIAALPSLSAGKFILVCPDIYEGPRPFNVRWLFTKHLTLDEEHIRANLLNKVVDAFNRPGGFKGLRVLPRNFGALPKRPKEQATTQTPQAQDPQSKGKTKKKKGAKEGKGNKVGRDKKGRWSRKQRKETEAEATPDQSHPEPQEHIHRVKISMGRPREKRGKKTTGQAAAPNQQKNTNSGKPGKGGKKKPDLSHDLVNTSIMSDIGVKLSEATKLARKLMKAKRYQGKANLSGGELVLVPLWCVHFTQTVTKRLWFFPLIKRTRELERGLYFSADSGGLLKVGVSINFDTEDFSFPKPNRDFDTLASFKESSNVNLPAKLPSPKLRPEAVLETVRQHFSVEPNYLKYALLPSWEFLVRNELGAQVDRLYIDATLGKQLER